MEHLENLRVFVAVAEERGFAMAARRLSLSAPAVTRAVAALEERIGARLFQRTTRVVRLTESGKRFFADCKRILGELEEAEASAAGSHADPRGQLGVTASNMFGRRFVAPILLDFLAAHRGVTARLVLVDRILDLMEEGLDVAVRIARLPDSTASAVRVGSVRRVLCAAPSYLAARGVPRVPSDLSALDAIAFAPTASPPNWSFTLGSRSESVSPPAQLLVNSAEVAIAAAVAGRGVTRVLSYQIARELQGGELTVILAEFEPPPLPIHVVHREGRRAAARVRAFVDYAVERLRTDASLVLT